MAKTRLTFYAGTLPHFCNFLAPLWLGLPDEYRGEFHARGRAASRAREVGIAPTETVPQQGLVCVASFEDYRATKNADVVLVNHGVGQTYCLAPETRVLTSDLRWTSLSEIRPEQKLVAFEEYPTDRSWRQWRTATVLSTQRLILPCYELTMEDGTRIISSAEHQWLKRMNETYGWLETQKFRGGERKTSLLKAFEPWEEDVSRDGGYLAAAFDGEGCLTQTRREPRQNRLMLTFTQRENAMLRHVEKLLRDDGFSISVSAVNSQGVVHLSILGGVPEVTRFLGRVRPHRLLENMKPLSNGQMRGKPVQVASCRFIGDHEVIGLTTDTGTFFAEGFASHNCGDPDSKAYRHPSYSGGIGRERVVLYLCPSESDVKVNVDAYPDADAIAVGPYHLDPWLREDGHELQRPPLVVISSHADIHICPETRSAFSEYQDAVRDLVRSNPPYTVWGHAHPRNRRHMEKFWRSLRVPFVNDFTTVLDFASLYVSDNSSTLYEFAATGRPVLVLNASWYRTEVEHGLRFWEHIPGIAIGRPEYLQPAVKDALEDGSLEREVRESAVDAAYNGVTLDGRLTERAVTALMSFLDAH